MKRYLFAFLAFVITFVVLTGIFVLGETASVILSLIIAVIFYNFWKKKISATKDPRGEDLSGRDEKQVHVTDTEENERGHEFGGIWGAKPREGTEAYRVQEEVRKRKKIAEEKQVKELVSDLYFDAIKYYPNRLKDKQNRDYVSSIVTRATTRGEAGNEGGRGKEITEITLNGKDYRFAFQESSFSTPDGEHHTHGLLELFSGDRRLLAINASLEYSRFLSEWKPFGIEAFIDGDWIEDFRALKKAKQKDERDRAVKKAEDPDRTAKLKKDFGIDE